MNTIEFSVEIDRKGPSITRVYNDGPLVVMTSESAICGYSHTDSRCGFDIENASLMSGEGKEHTTGWQTKSNYYIKCKDQYGNKPGRCSIIVRPYGAT